MNDLPESWLITLPSGEHIHITPPRSVVDGKFAIISIDAPIDAKIEFNKSMQSTNNPRRIIALPVNIGSLEEIGELPRKNSP